MPRHPADAALHRSRRHLLGACLGGAALGLLPRAALAVLPAGERRSWVPSADLLADLPRQMRALGVPGVGIAVVEGGELVWSQGFGLLHAGRDTPVTDGTLFEIASLSKPVFAYLVLQLVDRGELALDQPLVDTLRPEYLGGAGPAAIWAEAITARDVLRHSAGLPNWRADPARERLVPVAAPGTRIDYSGEAFVWLQRVVETITGESLDRTMQRLLFGPAGMRDSSYGWSAALGARSVYGHAAPDVPGKELPQQLLREQWQAAQPVAERIGRPLSDWRYEDAARALPEVLAGAPEGLVHWPGDIVANAAASLRCSVGDYARFMALMVHAHRADWELRPATRMAMLQPQIEIPGRWSEKTLGWNLEATTAGPVFFHAGSNGGIFKNFAIGDARRQRALVVATNAAQGNLLYRRVVRAATGTDLLAFDV